MYQVSLEGPAFLEDSAKIWRKMKKLLLGTPAWEWIQHLDLRENGRLGFQTLRAHYEGKDIVDKRVVIAKSIIGTGPNGAFYKNEQTFSFEKYATRLRQAYTTLAICRQPFAEATMVRRLYDGILITNNTQMELAKAYILDHCNDDFNKAVSYMSSKVNLAFPPQNLITGLGGHKRGPIGNQEGGFCKISKARGLQGRAGRFNFARAGRYGRGGRHGSGGRHGTWNQGRSGQRGPHKPVFNGIDCTDVTYSFSKEEWESIGHEGRQYVLRGRDKLKIERNGSANDSRHIEEVRIPGSVQDNDNDASVLTGPGNSEKGSQAGRGFGRGAYGRGKGRT